MYEIKVLSEKEFDDIAASDPRYSYVDESNLGFADREKGIAYVKQTHVHDLNKYLISHELEELEKDESSHEDPNGIRHKKGPKFFKDIILPALSFGLIQSDAPKRAAAQTQNVPGVGNVSVNDLWQYQQQPGPGYGSYTPSYGSSNMFGGFGGSPLNLFSGSGSYSPGQVPGTASGSYSPGLLGEGLNQLPDYLRQQVSGQEAGRISF